MEAGDPLTPLDELQGRLEADRAAAARRAVAEERQRIARELHDVVAHSVSVMTVQAGAVRRLLNPEQERGYRDRCLLR
jgi:signal transduction histidine kinase